MKQPLKPGATRSRLQLSTPDLLVWRKWRRDFWEAKDGERLSFRYSENYFKRTQSNARILWGTLTERYEPRKAYEEAKRKHAPLLSPHGHFRALAHRNNFQAREFLETFGPLTLRGGLVNSGGQLSVNMGEFWVFHRRFCSLAQLWEAHSDREKLVSAWRNVWEHRDEAALLEGSLCDVWPWQRMSQDFEKWVEQESTKALQIASIDLIHSELNLHSTETQVHWVKGWEPTWTKLRQVVRPASLWDAIWLFFGWDTAGEGWRRCPHCQQLFYPRRKDQYYCTRRQQELASKRDYARRMRSGSLKRNKRRKP